MIQVDEHGITQVPNTDWMGERGLTVRAQNVLERAHLDTLEKVHAASDVDLLRLRNAGRRVLDELRARGLRPDSCSTAGCQLPAGHPRDHVLFASRYAAKPARPAPAQPRRIFGEDVNGTAPLEVAVVLSGIGQRPITITLLPERVRSVNVICFSRAQAALLADELRVRLAEAGP